MCRCADLLLWKGLRVSTLNLGEYLTEFHLAGYGRMAPAACLMLVVFRGATCSSSLFFFLTLLLSLAFLSFFFFFYCRLWLKTRLYFFLDVENESGWSFVIRISPFP